jgi:hypothetical protein
MGPLTLDVTRTDGGLRATIPTAGTVALQPAGGLRFRAAGFSALSLSFESAADGTVERVVVHPIGLFQPVAQEAGTR